jgi:hypothetical protein
MCVYVHMVSLLHCEKMDECRIILHSISYSFFYANVYALFGLVLNRNWCVLDAAPTFILT